MEGERRKTQRIRHFTDMKKQIILLRSDQRKPKRKNRKSFEWKGKKVSMSRHWKKQSWSTTVCSKNYLKSGVAKGWVRKTGRYGMRMGWKCQEARWWETFQLWIGEWSNPTGGRLCCHWSGQAGWGWGWRKGEPLGDYVTKGNDSFQPSFLFPTNKQANKQNKEEKHNGKQ